ncbi:hypothetical protein J5N97_019541 [Dioscorea zingiberensis]|uniref:Uncharacterized protein n=1 Tax=Dioscorea zingiberensis TaxID=325984 RepID=A0A9D5HCT9_9LILI|nr:hypothetical protein J5N97_019541 [Dioscorea zingiberensis]
MGLRHRATAPCAPFSSPVVYAPNGQLYWPPLLRRNPDFSALLYNIPARGTKPLAYPYPYQNTISYSSPDVK